MKRYLIVMLSCAIVASFVARATAQPSPTPAAPSPSAAPTGVPPAAPSIGPQMQGRPIERVQFRGNRKVEDDAIRVQLLSKPGALFDAAKMREDIRAMWKMGFFADVNVEAEIGASGGLILTFAVKEKPSIRKVLVAGNSELLFHKRLS